MNFSRLLFRLALGRRLPVTAGEVRTPGVAGPVTIRRDRWGIPHVDAGSAADAAFGLGFCQAQDRGFQLETVLRVGRGTLAELVGPAGLGVDRMSRRIGFRRAAVAQLPVLDADVRDQITAFAAGVSAGFARGLTAKPHEFAVLGGDPTPWDAADVLAFLKLMSFLLPSNWDVELARLRILRADGPAAVRDLDPVYPDWQPVTAGGSAPPAAAVLDRLSADLAAFQRVVPAGGGSNNWVISGSRTVSGKPLLASDPHLGPTLPPPWYLAHARTPDWAVAGAMFAGAPAFPIGHNGFACWGVTAGLTDTTDLFVETLGPDGTTARGPDGAFAACNVVREVIRIKGRPDVIEDVLVTPRGPVISPVIPGVSEVISLRAVWLDPLPLRGFVDAPAATDFASFRKPFAAWPVLPLNVVYADSAGTIGWQLIGQLPVRTGGNGLFPRPADLPDSGWAGLVPFDEMPHFTNPAEGFIGTANNPPVFPPSPLGGEGWGEGNGYPPGETSARSGSGSTREVVPSPGLRPPSPPRGEGQAFLGADFVDGYRCAVIREELARHAVGWTAADCLKLQRNVRSKPWEEMRDIVLSLVEVDPDARRGLDLLRAWDGQVSADSPAAAVFEVFVAEMAVRVAKAKAPAAWAEAVGGNGAGLLAHNLFGDRRVGHLVRLLRAKPDGWFPGGHSRERHAGDDVRAGGWDAELVAAVAAAVRTLTTKLGPSPRWWTWGDARPLVLRHQVFGKSRLLGRVFNRGPVPCGGDQNTVSQAGVRPLDPLAPTHNMANLRAVFDPADWPNSRFVLCGGQSGNPLSAHFDDQFPLWQRGDAVPIPWTPEEVLRAAVSSLRLTPDATG